MLKIKVKRHSDQRAASQDTRHVFSYLPVLDTVGRSGRGCLKFDSASRVSLPRDRRLIARNAASLFQSAERKYADDRHL
jgi:hypothetical protein